MVIAVQEKFEKPEKERKKTKKKRKIKGLKFVYKKRLNKKKSRLNGDFITVFIYEKEGKNLFTVFIYDTIRINEHSSQLRRFKLDIRKIFLIVRMLKLRIDFPGDL